MCSIACVPAVARVVGPHQGGESSAYRASGTGGRLTLFTHHEAGDTGPWVRNQGGGDGHRPAPGDIRTQGPVFPTRLRAPTCTHLQPQPTPGGMQHGESARVTVRISRRWEKDLSGAGDALPHPTGTPHAGLRTILRVDIDSRARGRQNYGLFGRRQRRSGSGKEGYPSGQRGQTVNLLAYAFGGSNPPPSTSFEFQECVTGGNVGWADRRWMRTTAGSTTRRSLVERAEGAARRAKARSAAAIHLPPPVSS